MFDDGGNQQEPRPELPISDPRFPIRAQQPTGPGNPLLPPGDPRSPIRAGRDQLPPSPPDNPSDPTQDPGMAHVIQTIQRMITEHPEWILKAQAAQGDRGGQNYGDIYRKLGMPNEQDILDPNK